MSHYYLSGASEAIEAIPETVDDLTPEMRCLVLYLIHRARRGPLSETNWNLFAAQTQDIRDRIRRNVPVREP